MIQERLQALREKMKERDIQAYLVPTDDFHGSEYVGDYFKCRQYITGFTGSAGTALVLPDMAGLWTDGRYFIQAERQMEGSGVTLFRMREPGVPTIHEFLKKHVKAGQCLGFDGRTVSAREAECLEKLMEENHAAVKSDVDLIGEIWQDRPALSCEPVWELELCWAGESREEKCRKIREEMKKKGADAFLLTSLEDIAWMLNIRGNDIHCCPVVLSYLLMTETEIRLFANKDAFSDSLREILERAGVSLYGYEEIYDHLAKLPGGMKVLLHKGKVNGRLVKCLPEDTVILDQVNLTLLPKALKNETEVANERIAHIKDGTAVTKFICWLKKNVGKIPITELSAAKKLEEFREEQEHFLGNSFDPIISYGEHAAMNHYSATPETDVPVLPEGLLLADTGGHYLEGSTDITRTVVMGEITAEQRKFFTAVLRGHLNLAAAKFRYGCGGVNLDYLARSPLWEMDEDFNHGTGHGVGYLLSVHEGPNGIRWRLMPDRDESAVLEPGMITSNEPGYYVEGEYGIRHENLMVCKEAGEKNHIRFLCFEDLTMVPFDLDGVDPKQMTEKERELLNQYHEKVYEKIAPHLTEEEREWLREATRRI